jgi:hypothetical protein
VATAKLAGIAGLTFAPLVLAQGVAAQTDLSGYQGAWLAQGPPCSEVYSPAGKSLSFRKPIDPFVPAFVISGKRLRTPTASCQIRSARPNGERQSLTLHCANSVSANDVTVLMAPGPDGTLLRYFNDQDTTGTSYQRCLP